MTPDGRTWKEKVADDTRRIESNPLFIVNQIDDRECQRSGHVPVDQDGTPVCDRCCAFINAEDAE